MSQELVLDLFREAIWLILKLSAPMLIVRIVIGLIIAIFQAATQIHEQTLTFVPKLVVIALMLVWLGSWMFQNLNEFFAHILNIMAGL